MSKRQISCEKVTPWFADGPFNPAASASADPVRVQQLPDKPVQRAKPAATPPAELPAVVVRKTTPMRRLVNWPVVAGIGAFVWFWVVGAILVGWLASSPAASEASASPVAAVAPVINPAPVVQVVRQIEFVGPVAPAQPPAEDVAVVQRKPDPAPVVVPVPVVEKPAPPAKEQIGKYGTTIDFIDDPIEAADKAMKNRKILFVLHVSGDFEDPGCT